MFCWGFVWELRLQRLDFEFLRQQFVLNTEFKELLLVAQLAFPNSFLANWLFEAFGFAAFIAQEICDGFIRSKRRLNIRHLVKRHSGMF